MDIFNTEVNGMFWICLIIVGICLIVHFISKHR